ncbi:MAG: phosphate ABC transporter substrate-binding/OmpA family protein [Dokdonella sp.]|uniref:phosphate ABC transporter substrate-binding/OmpA family protein n=1 Tax=Dokdonella sp. TaxID=2291710 RepID=UPI0032672FE4
MVRLTGLSKALIAIAILGAAGSVAWHLGLRDMIQRGSIGTTASTAPNAQASMPPAPNGAPATTVPQATTKPPAVFSGKGALGSPGNPLKVSIVSFHGYAPALVANGNSLTTQPGSIYEKAGVNVQFIIQDDIPTLSTIFESNTAQCAWRTSDFWAQEQPNLRNAGHDGRAVVIVDNTQGGDAIVTRDPNIRRVEDLAGHSVALLQYTPSDGLAIDAIDNSSMTAKAKSSVKFVYINADEGTAGVRAALESGSVDAIVLWDPDLSLALKNVPGAHVIYSTKVATNLIYDVMVCDSRYLNKPENVPVFQAFVAGWMSGVEEAQRNPDKAVDALVQTEQLFALLAKDQGRDFVKSTFANLVWTGLADNARILGLAGGPNHYERVYHKFDEIYRKEGALANPNSPVIAAQDSFDYRFIKAMLAKNEQAKVVAAEPQATFTQSGLDAAAAKAPEVTKPILVNFASGSTELSKRSQKTIDEELVSFIENHGSAYFEISGNTDSTGSREVNTRLSRSRAAAVVDYLTRQWEFPANRFRINGYGSERPLCNESNPAGDGMSLEDCRALNRTTRAAVLAR